MTHSADVKSDRVRSLDGGPAHTLNRRRSGERVVGQDDRPRPDPFHTRPFAVASFRVRFFAY